MGKITWGLSEDLASVLQEHFRFAAAVETGTYQGNSTVLLEKLTGEVHTVESDPDLFRRASQRLERYPGIRLQYGESPKVLPGILAQLSYGALFWLDAHWFPLVPELNGSQCPVLEELAILANWPWIHESCVLVDDAHMFAESVDARFRQSDWPSIDQVISACSFSASRVVRVVDDVVVSGPAGLETVLDHYQSHDRTLPQLLLPAVVVSLPRPAVIDVA
jgi:hypothetical protein